MSLICHILLLIIFRVSQVNLKNVNQIITLKLLYVYPSNLGTNLLKLFTMAYEILYIGPLVDFLSSFPLSPSPIVFSYTLFKISPDKPCFSSCAYHYLTHYIFLYEFVHLISQSMSPWGQGLQSIPYLRYIEQWLAHSRCSINIFWINEWYILYFFSLAEK